MTVDVNITSHAAGKFSAWTSGSLRAVTEFTGASAGNIPSGSSARAKTW